MLRMGNSTSAFCVRAEKPESPYCLMASESLEPIDTMLSKGIGELNSAIFIFFIKMMIFGTYLSV